MRAELLELKRSFQAREARLLQQVESLRGQLAAAAGARDAAEAELRQLHGAVASQTTPSSPAGGIEGEVHRQGRELQRLSSAFSSLELDSQERHSAAAAAERSCAAHVKHLEELIRSSQSQQQQFCSDLQALWAEVSRQRAPATPAALPSAGDAAPNGARRARTSEERMNDLAANALLRNIYSAVSELP